MISPSKTKESLNDYGLLREGMQGGCHAWYPTQPGPV
jgi:hypothetical protein